MKTLRHWFHTFDEASIRWVLQLPLGWRPLMHWCSDVGRPTAMTIITISLFIFAYLHRQHSWQVAAILTLMALPLSAITKGIFRRIRPQTAAILGLHNYSFPSGHSYSSLVVMGLLAYVMLGWVQMPLGAIIAGALGLFATIVGLSRVYLGAHYPTDVLGGWLLGSLLLTLIIRSSHL